MKAGRNPLAERGWLIADKTYDADVPVGLYVAVVQGAVDGSITLPAGQNVPKFAGVTQTSGDASLPVCVRKFGLTTALSGSAISAGNHVAINSAAGDVYDVEAAIEAGLHTPAEVIYAIGTAETSADGSGVQIEVFLNPQVITLAAS